MVKYKTTYLFADVENYYDYGFKKVYPIYIDEIDDYDGTFSVKMFNENETKILNKMAWFGEGDLVEYTEENKDKLQKELDQMWLESEW